MQISNVNIQNGVAEMVKKVSPTQKIEVNAEKQPANASANVSISGNAHGKSGSAEALVRARASALPEIREELVAQAKERIQSGFYNTPEFSNELANRLVEG